MSEPESLAKLAALPPRKDLRQGYPTDARLARQAFVRAAREGSDQAREARQVALAQRQLYALLRSLESRRKALHRRIVHPQRNILTAMTYGALEA